MEKDLQVKRKREEPDVAPSPSKKIKGECNRTGLSDLYDQKTKAPDDGPNPSKRGNYAIETPTEIRVDSKKRTREAEDGSEAPEKRRKSSHSSSSSSSSSSSNVSFITVSSNSLDSSSSKDISEEDIKKRKREAQDGNEAPEKRRKSSHSSSSSHGPFITASSSSLDSSTSKEISEEDIEKRKREAEDGSEASEKRRKSSHSSSGGGRSGHSINTVSSGSYANAEIIYHDLGRVSDEEENIYRMSSSAKTSRADFKEKYCEIFPLGSGGFGTVYGGFRKPDLLPVAIKHIAGEDVEIAQVKCNGKEYKVITEIAFMLKAGGLPGTVGQSTAVSILDWYSLENELILVMEKPSACVDLEKYLEAHRGSLSELAALKIFKKLVDATVDIHSKGVFHSDIKPENILIQVESGETRIRMIDFGCSSLLKEEPYDYFSGTLMYAPPEWFLTGFYWAEPFTVWQLGALLFSMLRGHEDFTTSAFMSRDIRINRELSKDCKSLLRMCLARNPDKRATLEQLQGHLAFR